MQRTDQPHQRAGNGGDAHIGRHGRGPRRPPGAAHQADRSAVLQQEHISGAQSEHDYWMPVQPVAEPTSPAEGEVFAHSQRVNVADAAMVEIARGGVMAGVHPLPVIVRRHRQDAECAADPVVDSRGCGRRRRGRNRAGSEIPAPKTPRPARRGRDTTSRICGEAPTSRPRGRRGAPPSWRFPPGSRRDSDRGTSPGCRGGAGRPEGGSAQARRENFGSSGLIVASRAAASIRQLTRFLRI